MDAGSPKRRPRRAVNGILLLDKPAGQTSNKVLQRVRWLYAARKAGHTGTLDPFATGMLPICFGEATKFSGRLLDQSKTYLATARLGSSTDSGDLTGATLETAPVPQLNSADVESALAHFHGPIEQVPPMFSALKHEGRRLYELAREGRTVDRPVRSVTIHDLQLVALSAEQLILRVRCSKGTYIRTLVEDIARQLGTVAHTTALRRETVDPFASHAMVTMEQLEDPVAPLDKLLLPIDTALLDLPRVGLDAGAAAALAHGQTIELDGAPGPVRCYGPEGFVGLGERHGGQLQAKRLLATGTGTKG